MLKYSPMATSSFVLAERYETHFSAFDFSAISRLFFCFARVLTKKRPIHDEHYRFRGVPTWLAHPVQAHIASGAKLAL